MPRKNQALATEAGSPDDAAKELKKQNQKFLSSMQTAVMKLTDFTSVGKISPLVGILKNRTWGERACGDHRREEHIDQGGFGNIAS
jgi:hypothetical protein